MITLTEDKVNSMRFDVEWEIMDLTQDLIKIIKSRSARVFDSKIVKDLDTLIEQRFNLIGAAMVFDSLSEEIKID
jgi:hypothetical protein